jgi:glycosyltransferase involved in cell wall biosynthesis
MSKPDTAKDRLRICILVFMFWPLVGGAEAQAEKHARQMRALGHEVIVITLRHFKSWRRRETLHDFPVVRLGGIYRKNGRLRIGKVGMLPISFALLYELWRLRQQYDIVHAMQLSSMAAIAALICKFTGKALVASVQSAGPDSQQQERFKKHGVRLMEDTLTGKVDRHFWHVNDKDWTPGDLESMAQSVVNARLLLKYLKQSDTFYQVLSKRSHIYLIENGFRPEQIQHIPNGIDTTRFCPPASLPDPNRPERDILCVARLEYPKGVDVLLHAWGRMMHEPIQWRAHIQPRLRIVGRGVFRPHLERIAEALGIQESVEFLGLRHDVIDLLQRSWGFVMPSRWEGMPNALLEAMACGLPCIATRVSGSEDIIIDGYNGLLIETEDPVTMAHALHLLLEDSQLARQMGQKARATILRDYRIESVTERCLQLYRHMQTEKKHLFSIAAEGRGKL